MGGLVGFHLEPGTAVHPQAEELLVHGDVALADAVLPEAI